MVYRPPNGSEIAELGEIDNIMQILPNERVIVFGDYNFDLFKPESQKFESSLYENNMIPLVSNPTHFKTGCDPSLIDNILTNSIENIIMSGVLESGVSQHHPFICFIDDTVPEVNFDQRSEPKFDYCETNLNRFSEKIKWLEHENMAIMYNTDMLLAG